MVEGVCKATIREKKMLEKRKNFEFDVLFEFFNCLTISSKESSCKIYQKEFYTRKSLLPTSFSTNKYISRNIIKIEKYEMVHEIKREDF